MTGRGQDGFSLFETMLVTGVIGLVVAVALPAFSDAHEAAVSARCKANLRQLAAACMTYSLKEGYFPWGMIDPASHDREYWGNQLLRERVYPLENPRRRGAKRWEEFSSYCWDFTRKAGQHGWSNGVIMDGANATSTFGCPKCAHERDNWDGNRMTGYNYNVCYLGFVENDASTRKYPTAWHTVTHPSRVVVFGDGGYAGGANKFMRAPFQDRVYDRSAAGLRKAGTQAFRHGRGRARHCNMAFADGHVEEFHTPYKAGGKPGWVDERTHTAFISSGNGIYGPRGFGMADDDEPR